MQWVAAGFLFVRGRTFIHKIDARVRLLLALVLFLVSILSNSIEEITILIVIVISVAAVAKIIRRFGKSMVFTLVISLLAFILNLVLPPRNLHLAIVFGLRLVAVISSTSLFFLTATPDELEQVMKWLHFPTDFVMVFVIAVRFVPVLLMDALLIMDAQRSRGLEFDKGNIIRKLRNMIPVLVPLIAVALNRSLDLAEAMDSRAYGATKVPTSLYKLSLNRSDYLVVSILVLGLLIGVYAALFVRLY